VAQRLDQPIVVALVQPDRGLVEHVHDAGQARTDLRGQPDALRLAPRQGLGRAVQRQVLQADIVQELQPVADLAHDALAHGGAVARQRQGVEPLQRVAQRPVRDFPDRTVVAARSDPDVARIQAMWEELLAQHGGPMLFVDFSIADAYYAPVCMRLRTYALPVSPTVQAYIDRVTALPSVAEWIAGALAEQWFVVEDEPYRLGR
jgi:glutathione S-transferase